MSDGSMKMDSVRGTGQSSSPVPLTWGFCIDSRNTRVSKHGKTCQKMSLVEVVCDVSSIIVIFGPAPNLEVFGLHFWMGGPMQMHLFTACHIAIPST